MHAWRGFVADVDVVVRGVMVVVTMVVVAMATMVKAHNRRMATVAHNRCMATVAQHRLVAARHGSFSTQTIQDTLHPVSTIIVQA